MPEKTLMYPGLPRFEPRTYDSSTVKLAKECLRKYFYRIILGRTSTKSTYQCVFDFGTAYHKFREVLEREYLVSANKSLSLAAALKVVSTMPLTPGSGKYEFYTKQRLVETCMAGFAHWSAEKDAGRIKVIAIEQPFNVMLPDGKFIGGRADQIVEWNGKVWGRDFKTTSKQELYFNATLDPADQATRYIYMESKLHYGDSAIDNGRFVGGIIFEVIQNTKTTAPKIYNTLVTKNQYQLKNWEREQMFMHKIIDTCTTEDMWPMQETSCSFCDFAKVCRAPSEASQENILRNEFNLSPWDFEHVEQTTIKEQ